MTTKTNCTAAGASLVMPAAGQDLEQTVASDLPYTENGLLTWAPCAAMPAVSATTGAQTASGRPFMAAIPLWMFCMPVTIPCAA